jgi:hypothetical protein
MGHYTRKTVLSLILAYRRISEKTHSFRTIYKQYNEKTSTKGKLMNTARKVVSSTKKFVYTHRIAVAVALTAVLVAKANNTALQQRDDFLKEHDLYETFYNTEN